MILLSLVISTKTAFAETAKLEVIKLDINVMPEYDTPDILIIYSVDLKNTRPALLREVCLESS